MLCIVEMYSAEWRFTSRERVISKINKLIAFVIFTVFTEIIFLQITLSCLWALHLTTDALLFDLNTIS